MIWLGKQRISVNKVLNIPVSGGILDQINNYPYYYTEQFTVQELERAFRDILDGSAVRETYVASTPGIPSTASIPWQAIGSTSDITYQTPFGTFQIMADPIADDIPQTYYHHEIA